MVTKFQKKTTIYFNKVKYNGAEYVKLYFKNDRRIEDRIKSNSWIKYSIRIHAYFIEYTEQNYRLLLDLFGDIAEINTKYFEPRVAAEVSEVIIGNDLISKMESGTSKKDSIINLLPIKDKVTSQN